MFRKKNDAFDPNRPNHFFHDSLGDPYACDGDHNHPTPDGIHLEVYAEWGATLVGAIVTGALVYLCLNLLGVL